MSAPGLPGADDAAERRCDAKPAPVLTALNRLACAAGANQNFEVEGAFSEMGDS